MIKEPSNERCLCRSKVITSTTCEMLSNLATTLTGTWLLVHVSQMNNVELHSSGLPKR